MRPIDGDSLKIALDTFATLVGFRGLYDRGQVMECIDAAPTIEGGSWIGADKRPKKPGKYLVYGVTMFVPDHNGEPCGCWEVKIANWSDKWGWDCKVKRWRPLPELPKEETT